jgi:hypothetical protein
MLTEIPYNTAYRRSGAVRQACTKRTASPGPGRGGAGEVRANTYGGHPPPVPVRVQAGERLAEYLGHAVERVRVQAYVNADQIRAG